MHDDFLKILNGGTFSLDPGAIFGITPKVSWERFFKPNQTGRIDLAVNIPLIKAYGNLIALDSGLNENMEERGRRFFEVKVNPNLSDQLYDLNADRHIDYTILSHLHFDHSVNICNAIIRAKKVNEKCMIALSEFLGSCYAMYKDSMSCFYSGNIEAMNAIIEKKKEVGQLKNNLLSSIDDDSLNLATAVSEEILRIGLYSTDIAELGMDYLLANETSFEIR